MVIDEHVAQHQSSACSRSYLHHIYMQCKSSIDRSEEARNSACMEQAKGRDEERAPFDSVPKPTRTPHVRPPPNPVPFLRLSICSRDHTHACMHSFFEY
jgi:hypothetical protein